MKQSKRKREPLADTSASVTPEVDATVTTAPSGAALGASDHRRFVLPPSCTVRDSIGLHASLVQIHSEPLPVTLDVTAVERIDTAMIQVLCAFVRDRRAVGASTDFVGYPEPFAEAVQLLGVATVLGIDKAQALASTHSTLTGVAA